MKRYGRKFSGMPDPVSVTSMMTNFPLVLRLAVSVILPSSVNLTAFAKTHDKSLARSLSSTVKGQTMSHNHVERHIPSMISGILESTDHSMILTLVTPSGVLLRTSMTSPPSVSSAMAESGLPPTLRDSLMVV